MRLVDADAILKADGNSDKALVLGSGKSLEIAYALLKKKVVDAPTVDAVIVTRCKDCKHFRNHPNGLCYLHTEPKANARGYSGDAVCVEPDDFCSYGERKDGGDG